MKTSEKRINKLSAMVAEGIIPFRYIKPKSGYMGGFIELSLCTDCYALSSKRDRPKYDPCSDCGGPHDITMIGKWVKPVRGFKNTFPFVGVIKEGYWKLKRDGVV